MIRATIKKLDGTILDHSEGESIEILTSWFSSFIENGIYGAKEYSYQSLVSDPVIDNQTGEEVVPAVYGTIIVPAEFNIEFTDITEELNAEISKADKISKGRAARQICEKVLDLIAGYNLDRELTIEQITQMQTTFANSEAALRSGRPTFAKAFISLIQVDGDLVTEEMKSEALSILSDY